MKFSLGIKSDPIEYRYTHSWLFSLMENLDVQYVQLGSFSEIYTLDEGFFHDLREEAESHRIRIKSCFTSHRELGGFLSGNRYLEKAARKNYERFINIASILGADYAGSNPGTVPRNSMEYKSAGIECYLMHMKELMVLAKEKGLKALTMEPMSSLAEPPTLPEELAYMLGTLADYHDARPSSTVPVYVCSDISHGYADREGKVVYDTLELLDHHVPFLAELHLKNTDRLFNSTFGFSPKEQQQGIIDLPAVKRFLQSRQDDIPVDHLVGYFETDGPKRGREYSDYKLKDELTASLEALKMVFS